MQKVAMSVLLTLLSPFAGAQTPSNPHKTVVGHGTAVGVRTSASEEATAAAQAAAIADAAARATVVSPVPVAVNPRTTPILTPTAPVQSGHETMSTEELAIAKRVHQGLLACELGASIRVEPDATQPGYFHLQGKGFRYRMRPVVTSTGAIRLEDHKAGAVWLQLANKSMLMDQKKGRRVADECAHPEQLAYAENMKTNPPPKLFDTNGMGR